MVVQGKGPTGPFPVMFASTSFWYHMTQIRAYKITVNLQRDYGLDSKATLDLHVNANMPDLTLLLHALDETAYVMGYTVFATFTVPDLSVLNKLTDKDLGIPRLKKLK